jgi:hypothetical protein
MLKRGDKTQPHLCITWLKTIYPVCYAGMIGNKILSKLTSLSHSKPPVNSSENKVSQLPIVYMMSFQESTTEK